MIQRGIGIAVGALVSLIFLIILVPVDQGWQDYIVPLVIGGLTAFFWPVVIGWYLGRRARQKREDQIQGEVQRQLDQERNQGR